MSISEPRSRCQGDSATTLLALTGTIPGLLRRGSPVMKTWQGDEDEPGFTAKGVVLERLENDEAGERWSCWFFDERIHRDTGFPPDLDLSDPTGRFHTLLWLRERGHDLRWAENEAEVLAWSVLSVARGGGPILAIGSRWAPQSSVGSTGWIRRVAASRCGTHVSLGTPLRVGSGLILAASSSKRKGADSAALAAGYALRNDDSTLTLPSLPKVPRG